MGERVEYVAHMAGVVLIGMGILAMSVGAVWFVRWMGWGL